MTQEHLPVERYLARLEEGLKSMTPSDREEVMRDIRSHISEATSAGASVDSVLTALGPADALARAYAVELLLNPAPGRPPLSGARRFFALLGILSLAFNPTLIVVATFGAIGVSLVASGIAVFLAGVVDAVGITLPFVDGPAIDVHPAFAIAVGPVLFLLGVASLWILWKYMQWLSQAIRRAVPKAR